MRRVTDTEARNELMTAIAEKLKKQPGEVTPTATQPRKGASLHFTEDDTVIHLQSTEDSIEQLSEVLLSLLEQRKG
jgi:hypothetical protein